MTSLPQPSLLPNGDPITLKGLRIMKQGQTNKSWNTCNSEYMVLHLLLRPNSVCSFIRTPLITFMMVNIALSESFSLKNELISDKNVVTLCASIGYESFSLQP
jgi:hypothetical protein